LLTGLLRKKGMFLYNDKIVRITSDGVLTYSDRDKPGRDKGHIDLKTLAEIRFIYAGRRVARDLNTD
jgi:hypothetical protein